MLPDFAPLTRMILRPDNMVKVEADWKIQTALASPWASSVRSAAFTSSDDVDL